MQLLPAVEEILSNPRHPYTQGLIECVPHLQLDPPKERPELEEIPGVVPALTSLGKGCPFAPRCNQAMDKCYEAMPGGTQVGEEHGVSCWLVSTEAA